MYSRIKRLLVLVGIVAASLVIPATSSPVSASIAPDQGQVVIQAWQKGHVNSNDSTRLFVSDHGETYYNVLGPCTDFWYDAISNGRYHTNLGGWVSMAKAGPGWCHD